jgi:predicted nucleotidyltransferase
MQDTWRLGLMSSVIEHNVPIPRKEFTEFCRRWRIAECAFFGSVLTEGFGQESDLDILVAFEEGADWSLLDHILMEQQLEELFDRKVDLFTRRSVERSSNLRRRKEILETAEAIDVT